MANYSYRQLSSFRARGVRFRRINIRVLASREISPVNQPRVTGIPRVAISTLTTRWGDTRQGGRAEQGSGRPIDSVEPVSLDSYAPYPNLYTQSAPLPRAAPTVRVSRERRGRRATCAACTREKAHAWMARVEFNETYATAASGLLARTRVSPAIIRRDCATSTRSIDETRFRLIPFATFCMSPLNFPTAVRKFENHERIFISLFATTRGGGNEFGG